MQLVLCDDNRLLCEALASVFHLRGHRVLAITTCVAEGIAAVATHRPDACLLDLRLPDGSGLDAGRAIRRCHPDTKILVLSCLTDPDTLAEAKEIGVTGFLCKDQSAGQVADALDVIARGGLVFDPGLPRHARRRAAGQQPDHPLYLLTGREKEVLRRLIDGQSTGEMANEMSIAISTVRTYVKNVLTKLGAHSRLEAATVASREGLVRDIPAA
jgi:two-component system, NarL family, nitrate/nitrite response regulator NarL